MRDARPLTLTLVVAILASIDDAQVGTDTFVVNLAGAHTRSRSFATPAGQHELRARA